MSKKLILFDIDGTILSTHGIPRIAMGNVLAHLYQNFNYDENYNFSGRTDWEIIEHLLTFDDRKVSMPFIRNIMDLFIEELDTQLQNGKEPLLFPGVKELIFYLSENKNTDLGLVTGNISHGARIKLEKTGLWKYFPVGGYGDDARDRSDLPPIAISRAEKYYKRKYEITDIWILGDSIYDISCAKDNSLCSLAVSTGLTEYETLKKSKPDVLVKNLFDLGKIVEILMGNNKHTNDK